MTLENGQFSGVEEVRRLYDEYVERQGQETSEVPYIETLGREGHKVFVTDSLHKTFGTFVGANTKGRAIVTFENKGGCYDFDGEYVISM